MKIILTGRQFNCIIEEYLGQVQSFEKSRKRYKVYKNPKNISRMSPNLRAICTPEGDLFVVDHGSFDVVHGELLEWLLENRRVVGLMGVGRRDLEDLGRYVWLMRSGNSNDFYLAESYMWDEEDYEKLEPGVYDENSMLNTLDNVKRKNPGYNFIMKRINGGNPLTN